MTLLIKDERTRGRHQEQILSNPVAQVAYIVRDATFTHPIGGWRPNGRLKAGVAASTEEVVAYRWREHVGPGEDFSAGFRSRADAQVWFERDPVRVVGALLDGAVRERIEAEVLAAIADAFAFAESSAFPADEELWMHMYGEAAR